MYTSFSSSEAIQMASKFNLGEEVRELIEDMGYSPCDALEEYNIC